jgi:hypothetical protein
MGWGVLIAVSRPVGDVQRGGMVRPGWLAMRWIVCVASSGRSSAESFSGHGSGRWALSHRAHPIALSDCLRNMVSASASSRSASTRIESPRTFPRLARSEMEASLTKSRCGRPVATSRS